MKKMKIPDMTKDTGNKGQSIKAINKALEEKIDRFDYDFQKKCVENRDFEGLEMYVMNLLMGVE